MNEDTIMEQLGIAAELLRNSQSTTQPHHVPERHSHRLALLAADYAAQAMVVQYQARQDITARAQHQSACNSRFRGPDPASDWQFLTAAQDGFGWPCYLVVESDTRHQSYECPRHDAQPQPNPCLSCPFVQSYLPDAISLPAEYGYSPSVEVDTERSLDARRPQAQIADDVISTLLDAVRAFLPGQNHQAVLVAIAQCAYFSVAAAQRAQDNVASHSADLDQLAQRHADLAKMVNHRLQAPSAWL